MTTPLFRAHPWHGISAGENAPEIINVYVEIVPSDTIKYELDKNSGILKVDRPQKYSNYCPALYGFIPQTYCGNSVAEVCMQVSAKSGLEGDKDPMDVCVLTERNIPRGDILLKARPLGGFRLVDKNEVDDKIISVLVEDSMYGELKDISELPKQWIDRLRHYFLTYKEIPGEGKHIVEIVEIYGSDAAKDIIRKSMVDYSNISE